MSHNPSFQDQSDDATFPLRNFGGDAPSATSGSEAVTSSQAMRRPSRSDRPYRSDYVRTTQERFGQPEAQNLHPNLRAETEKREHSTKYPHYHPYSPRSSKRQNGVIPSSYLHTIPLKPASILEPVSRIPDRKLGYTPDPRTRDSATTVSMGAGRLKDLSRPASTSLMHERGPNNTVLPSTSYPRLRMDDASAAPAVYLYDPYPCDDSSPQASSAPSSILWSKTRTDMHAHLRNPSATDSRKAASAKEAHDTPSSTSSLRLRAETDATLCVAAVEDALSSTLSYERIVGVKAHPKVAVNTTASSTSSTGPTLLLPLASDLPEVGPSQIRKSAPEQRVDAKAHLIVCWLFALQRSIEETGRAQLEQNQKIISTIANIQIASAAASASLALNTSEITQLKQLMENGHEAVAKVKECVHRLADIPAQLAGLQLTVREPFSPSILQPPSVVLNSQLAPPFQPVGGNARDTSAPTAASSPSTSVGLPVPLTSAPTPLRNEASTNLRTQKGRKRAAETQIGPETPESSNLRRSARLQELVTVDAVLYSSSDDDVQKTHGNASKKVKKLWDVKLASNYSQVVTVIECKNVKAETVSRAVKALVVYFFRMTSLPSDRAFGACEYEDETEGQSCVVFVGGKAVPADDFPDCEEAAGKDGSESERAGTANPVHKGHNGSDERDPKPPKGAKLRAEGSCEGERSGPEGPNTAERRKQSETKTLVMRIRCRRTMKRIKCSDNKCRAALRDADEGLAQIVESQAPRRVERGSAVSSYSATASLGRGASSPEDLHVSGMRRDETVRTDTTRESCLGGREPAPALAGEDVASENEVREHDTWLGGSWNWKACANRDGRHEKRASGEADTRTGRLHVRALPDGRNREGVTDRRKDDANSAAADRGRPKGRAPRTWASRGRENETRGEQSLRGAGNARRGANALERIVERYSQGGASNLGRERRASGTTLVVARERVRSDRARGTLHCIRDGRPGTGRDTGRKDAGKDMRYEVPVCWGNSGHPSGNTSSDAARCGHGCTDANDGTARGREAARHMRRCAATHEDGERQPPAARISAEKTRKCELQRTKATSRVLRCQREVEGTGLCNIGSRNVYLLQTECRRQDGIIVRVCEARDNELRVGAAPSRSRTNTDEVRIVRESSWGTVHQQWTDVAGVGEAVAQAQAPYRRRQPPHAEAQKRQASAPEGATACGRRNEDVTTGRATNTRTPYGELVAERHDSRTKASCLRTKALSHLETKDNAAHKDVPCCRWRIEAEGLNASSNETKTKDEVAVCFGNSGSCEYDSGYEARKPLNGIADVDKAAARAPAAYIRKRRRARERKVTRHIRLSREARSKRAKNETKTSDDALACYGISGSHAEYDTTVRASNGATSLRWTTAARARAACGRRTAWHMRNETKTRAPACYGSSGTRHENDAATGRKRNDIAGARAIRGRRRRRARQKDDGAPKGEASAKTKRGSRLGGISPDSRRAVDAARKQRAGAGTQRKTMKRGFSEDATWRERADRVYAHLGSTRTHGVRLNVRTRKTDKGNATLLSYSRGTVTSCNGPALTIYSILSKLWLGISAINGALWHRLQESALEVAPLVPYIDEKIQQAFHNRLLPDIVPWTLDETLNVPYCTDGPANEDDEDDGLPTDCSVCAPYLRHCGAAYAGFSDVKAYGTYLAYQREEVAKKQRKVPVIIVDDNEYADAMKNMAIEAGSEPRLEVCAPVIPDQELVDHMKVVSQLQSVRGRRVINSALHTDAAAMGCLQGVVATLEQMEASAKTSVGAAEARVLKLQEALQSEERELQELRRTLDSVEDARPRKVPNGLVSGAAPKLASILAAPRSEPTFFQILTANPPIDTQTPARLIHLRKMLLTAKTPSYDEPPEAYAKWLQFHENRFIKGVPLYGPDWAVDLRDVRGRNAVLSRVPPSMTSGTYEQRHHHADCLLAVLRVLSIPGEYASILQRHGIDIAGELDLSCRFAPPGSQYSPPTEVDVVQLLAGQGLTVQAADDAWQFCHKFLEAHGTTSGSLFGPNVVGDLLARVNEKVRVTGRPVGIIHPPDLDWLPRTGLPDKSLQLMKQLKYEATPSLTAAATLTVRFSSAVTSDLFADVNSTRMIGREVEGRDGEERSVIQMGGKDLETPRTSRFIHYQLMSALQLVATYAEQSIINSSGIELGCFRDALINALVT
ncbi:hypothetical protein B0H11DRAFT_1914941 [Mycena galericulata]|nr:hypothetical protein B0H11DRAFT_1914941 [Mycena galericulata]